MWCNYIVCGKKNDLSLSLYQTPNYIKWVFCQLGWFCLFPLLPILLRIHRIQVCHEPNAHHRELIPAGTEAISYQRSSAYLHIHDVKTRWYLQHSPKYSNLTLNKYVIWQCLTWKWIISRMNPLNIKGFCLTWRNMSSILSVPLFLTKAFVLKKSCLLAYFLKQSYAFLSDNYKSINHN